MLSGKNYYEEVLISKVLEDITLYKKQEYPKSISNNCEHLGMLYHSHKKQKDSLETKNSIRRSDPKSTFFKIENADENFLYEDDFDAIIIINDCKHGDIILLDMLDNDNITTTNSSEAAEKIPTDETDNRKYYLCVVVCIITAYPVEKVRYYWTHPA